MLYMIPIIPLYTLYPNLPIVIIHPTTIIVDLHFIIILLSQLIYEFRISDIFSYINKTNEGYVYINT